MKAASHRLMACPSKDEFARHGKRARLPVLWGLVWALLIMLLAGLGFWQLERAEQKRRWMSQVEAARLAEPDVASIDEALSAQRWQSVELTVEWIPASPVMLDNRTSQGRAGYEVLVPARLLDGGVAMINLGWVEAPIHREQPPRISLPQGAQRIQAVVGYPPETYTLSDQEDALSWRVQRIDADQLSTRWHLRLEPWVLWLERPAIPGVEARQLMAQQMPPERHLGYATQWFGLAAVLAVMGMLLFWRSRNR